MRKIFIVLLILLSFNINYAQNDEIGNSLFEYCVDKIGDWNAIIYLYKSEYKDELISIEKLKQYALKNELNISFNMFDELIVNEDNENNIAIHLGLSKGESSLPINDSLSAEKINCTISLSAPISEGSSIRNVSGQIKKAIVVISNSDTIEITDYVYDGALMIRVDISEIKRLKLKLENNYEYGTPEWVFKESQNKLAEGDYESMASLIENVELDSFKSIFDEVVKLDTTNELLSALFPDISDPDEFIELSSQKFMAEFFRAIFSLNPQLVESLINVKVKLLGKVYEGDNLVHIITRNTRTLGESDLSMIEVKSVKLVNGKWYMTLQDEIVQMGYQLKNSMMNR